MTAERAVTVVVADDHPAVVDAVSRYLRTRGFDVLGGAADGETALATVLEARPAVLVADARMPWLDGVELARRIRERAPGTAVVVYSGFGSRSLAADALAAGAAGLVLKDAPLEELSRAVSAAAAGRRHLDAVLLADLLGGGHAELSGREREVLVHVAEGLDYAEIGARLFLSPDTVRSHIQHALAKLGAHSRPHAVALAFRQGLIS